MMVVVDEDADGQERASMLHVVEVKPKKFMMAKVAPPKPGWAKALIRVMERLFKKINTARGQESPVDQMMLDSRMERLMKSD